MRQLLTFDTGRKGGCNSYQQSESGVMQHKMNTKAKLGSNSGLLFLLCFLFFAVTILVTRGQLAHAQHWRETVDSLNDQLIAIYTGCRQLDLSNNQPVFPSGIIDRFEGSPHGSFVVEVATVLPKWGVSIEADSFRGTIMQLPPDRIWVKTIETYNNFVPLSSQVPVIFGSEVAPVFESNVEVAVRPDWLDAAGLYKGELVLRPNIPGYISRGTRELSYDMLLGKEHTITVCFSIPEIIELSVPETEISFNVMGGPGMYQADKPVKFQVTTNASRWMIVCEASSFQDVENNESEVSLDQIQWKLKSEEPFPVETTGTLDPGVTFLEGNGPVKDLQISIFFSITILPSNLAGTYTANIGLMGKVAQ